MGSSPAPGENADALSCCRREVVSLSLSCTNHHEVHLDEQSGWHLSCNNMVLLGDLLKLLPIS